MAPPGTSQWARRHGPPRASSERRLLTAPLRTNARLVGVVVAGPRLPLVSVGDLAHGDRVPAPLGARVDRVATADGRPPPLELVHRQVDPPGEQDPEGRLQPLPGHQPLEVAVLASGPPKQRPVRAVVPSVDAGAGERQEVRGPSFQAPPKDRARLGGGHGVPEHRRHPAEEPYPGTGLGQRGPERSVASRRCRHGRRLLDRDRLPARPAARARRGPGRVAPILAETPRTARGATTSRG